uniref:NADH-quinone oxidoreductase subunit L n=1 Tax=Anaerolinea thermolimosa TaxID=229919 RepID=A0A7C4PK00_9CHLR
MASNLILLVIGLPWIGALLVWWAGDNHPRWQHNLAIGFSVAAGIAALALLPLQSSQPGLSLPAGGVFGDFSFVPDGLGVMLAAIATVIGSLAVIFSKDYMHGEAQLGRYYALVLFFIGSMAGLVLTSNLFLMFLFWEITALCSYALISFYNDDPKAVAGGIKALVITQLGGIGLLVAAVLTYSYLGSFDLSVLLKDASRLPPNVLGILAFGSLIAAAAKSAQFPFQTWLPDAMEAPTPVSALIHAATMVNAGVYLLARFYPAFESVPFWRDAVMLVGVLSALMAALMALVATDLKRALAYSTVSQLGYMVYAVGAGGVLASQFHLLSHAIFKALLFLGAGAVIHSVGTRDMRQMGGLKKQLPFVWLVFGVGALALAGLPVLNGFWSKELILEAGLSGGPGWMFGVMVFSAGLTALYTFRFVWLVFYGEPRSQLHGHDAGPAMKVALAPLAVGALFSWLLMGGLSEMLAATLPYHEIHPLTIGEMALEILTAPATWLAMGVIALGLAAWWWRSQLQLFTEALQGIARAAEQSFGFEAINGAVLRLTTQAAEDLRELQTGLLNWNILAIVTALAVVVALLALGA